ncbi:hypothetical protein [Agromyces lapidis]|uniref:DUF4232 domain-containing protein n=1 Tax=Agromyces lapidis TaxID=279574 RepID=A0ABV5SP27_9MICO|nr:hypothetical protein [Agromyces lapidis]
MPRADAARRRAWPALVPVLALLGALAACSAPVIDDPDPLPLPAGLSAGVQQGRLDVEARRIVVHLENAGPAPVSITGVQLEVPALGAVLQYDDGVELSADDAIDLRLELPPPGCAAVGDEPIVRLQGRVETAPRDFVGELTPDDPFDTLPRIVAGDCLESSVAEVATIAMPEHLRVESEGAAQRAWIDVTVDPAPSGAGSLAISLVRGSTLLGNEAGTDWPLDLAVTPGDAPVVVPLAVRPARCDPHVLADDKRGTILAFVVATGDGRTGLIDRPSSDALKAELYDYVTERCGLS